MSICPSLAHHPPDITLTFNALFKKIINIPCIFWKMMFQSASLYPPKLDNILDKPFYSWQSVKGDACVPYLFDVALVSPPEAFLKSHKVRRPVDL